MNEVKGLINGTGVNPWIYSAAVFAVVLLVGMTVRRLLWTRLTSWASRTAVEWDDDLLESISLPVTIIMLILSFGIAGQSAPVIVRTHPLMVYGVKVAMMFAIMWMIQRAVGVLFRSSAIPESVGSSTRTLLLTIARVTIFLLGSLIILDTIGVSITPVLASLGVGSVAVALALQDTLSNFFGGLYILADKPIRIGDLVKVEDIEGEVVQIGWRSTRIRSGSNDIVVVPNSKVASAQIRNYDLPDSNSVLTVPCGVAYGSDLHRTERIAIEVAREVSGRIQGINRAVEPAVRFTSFADSSIGFNLVVQVSRFSEGALVRHELIKALHQRFAVEKIDIPFPQRVIHWNPPPGP